MYLLREQNFRNGFPYYNQNYRKWRLLFNPIIRNLFFVFILTKDFISYYITEDTYTVYTTIHFSWNLLYFVTICYYSKQLLKVENNRLQSIIDSKSSISLRVVPIVLRDFDAINRKIFEFNEIWFKFLLIAVSGIGAEIGVFALQGFSPKIPNIYIRFGFIFFVVISVSCVSCVTTIVIICTSVKSEAKRSHKLLTKLNARRDLKISLRIRIKVCIELNSNYLFSIQKLMDLIERCSENRIGFYCWKLFKMNEFMCYQVSYGLHRSEQNYGCCSSKRPATYTTALLETLLDCELLLSC